MAVDLSMPVLVVDDYQKMIRIIRNLLNQLGFKNIEEAKDGRQALEKLLAFGLVLVWCLDADVVHPVWWRSVRVFSPSDRLGRRWATSWARPIMI